MQKKGATNVRAMWLGGVVVFLAFVAVAVFGNSALQTGRLMRLTSNTRLTAQEVQKPKNTCGVVSANDIVASVTPTVINPLNNEMASFCYYVQKDLLNGFSLTVYAGGNMVVKTLYASNSVIKTGASGTLSWDGKDNNGTVVANGDYYYKFIAAGNTVSAGMVSVASKVQNANNLMLKSNPLALPSTCEQILNKGTCAIRSDCNWVDTAEFQRCETKPKLGGGNPGLLMKLPTEQTPPPTGGDDPKIPTPPITHRDPLPTIPMECPKEWSRGFTGTYFYYPPPDTDYAVLDTVTPADLVRMAAFARLGCTMRVNLEDVTNSGNAANNSTVLYCTPANTEVQGGQGDTSIACSTAAGFSGAEFNDSKYGTFQYDKFTFAVRFVNGQNRVVVMKNRYGTTAPMTSTGVGAIVNTSFFDPTHWDYKTLWRVTVSVQK